MCAYIRPNCNRMQFNADKKTGALPNWDICRLIQINAYQTASGCKYIQCISAVTPLRMFDFSNRCSCLDGLLPVVQQLLKLFFIVLKGLLHTTWRFSTADIDYCCQSIICRLWVFYSYNTIQYKCTMSENIWVNSYEEKTAKLMWLECTSESWITFDITKRKRKTIPHNRTANSKCTLPKLSSCASYGSRRSEMTSLWVCRVKCY